MTNFQVDVAATVSRGDERTELLWAGGTALDVIQPGAIFANASPHGIETVGPPPAATGDSAGPDARSGSTV